MKPYLLLSLLVALLPACSYPSYAPYVQLELKSSEAPPGQVTATFLGVTTILLDDGTTAIMTDAFFSRPSMAQMLAPIGPNDKRIDDSLRGARVSRASDVPNRPHTRKLDALMVAHSHYDHALDSGRVAKRTGALLVGSNSTKNIGLGEDLAPTGIETIGDGSRFACGSFKITVVASPHAEKNRFKGEIDKPLIPPKYVGAYKEGGNYSFLIQHRGLNILIHPSATAVSKSFNDVRADVVFLAIGMLGQQSDKDIEDYWNTVVRATDAKLVIPTHWDDFFSPLDEPLRPTPRPLDEVERAMNVLLLLANRDNVAVRFMPVFKPVDLETEVARVPTNKKRSEVKRVGSSPPQPDQWCPKPKPV